MLTSKLTKWRLFSPRMQNHCSLMKKSTMKHLCYEVMQKLTTEDVSTEACSRRQAPLIKKPTMKHLYYKDMHETSLVRRHEKTYHRRYIYWSVLQKTDTIGESSFEASKPAKSLKGLQLAMHLRLRVNNTSANCGHKNPWHSSE